ncbi:hypothetical protein H5410_030467 [Solanum commersonii]|uniref:Uncharacterized protein n=1 Tax=Solanum commersonii TaxID=4109 RepID=A0A9J5YFR9_SOLCO|nr:hypothetical protein H5410_030467 [Solanum commersonii]
MRRHQRSTVHSFAVLYLDTASIQKTRGSVARVKVQIDLTKERPPHVWIGLNEEYLNIGRWQTIEYEHIPDYCMYCKHQGHLLHVCTIKQRDEEFKKTKELEADRKNKNKGEQGKQNSRNLQMQYTNREDGNTSSQYQQHQKQGNNNKPADEEWQTQKRKAYMPVQYSMGRPKSSNLLRKHCSSNKLITQGQVQKIQDNNDNISGRQDLITLTSETKKKDHPGPTCDNS